MVIIFFLRRVKAADWRLLRLKTNAIYENLVLISQTIEAFGE